MMNYDIVDLDYYTLSLKANKCICCNHETFLKVPVLFIFKVGKSVTKHILF